MLKNKCIFDTNADWPMPCLTGSKVVKNQILWHYINEFGKHNICEDCLLRHGYKYQCIKCKIYLNNKKYLNKENKCPLCY